MVNKPTVIVIGGPTAIGKTKMAISLAEHLDTEIISADSRQIYHQLKIGVGRPSDEELARVKHHLIGTVDIQDHYHAADFERDALQILDNIFQEKSTAIVCGGTGLYIQTLVDGIDQMPDVDPQIREQLNNRFEKEGIEFLQKIILEKDPELISSIDMKNHKRLIRAAEIIIQTGQPFSILRKNNIVQRPFDTRFFCLYDDREIIRSNIEKRVYEMIDEGWVEECENLLPFKHLKALQTVGYKEIFQYLDGQLDWDTTQQLIITHTYQYAKRQLTWFKRDARYSWVKNIQELYYELK